MKTLKETTIDKFKNSTCNTKNLVQYIKEARKNNNGTKNTNTIDDTINKIDELLNQMNTTTTQQDVSFKQTDENINQ